MGVAVVVADVDVNVVLPVDVVQGQVVTRLLQVVVPSRMTSRDESTN